MLKIRRGSRALLQDSRAKRVQARNCLQAGSTRCGLCFVSVSEMWFDIVGCKPLTVSPGFATWGGNGVGEAFYT